MSSDPRERRAEARVTLAFLISAAAALVLAGVYIAGGQPQLEGIFLGLSLLALAFGFVTWGNHLMPAGPYTDDRHPLAPSGGEPGATGGEFDPGGVLSPREMPIPG